MSGCSLNVLLCCPIRTLAAVSVGLGPDRVLTNQAGLSWTIPYLHVLIALTISTNPTKKSTAKFLRHWHLLECLAAHPHTPSTTTSRHRTEPRPFSPTDKSIPSPITQNGQDLVSANLILAEVDHGRQSKLLRVERTAVNRATRKTDDEPRKTKKIARHEADALRNLNSMPPVDRKQLGQTTERDGTIWATRIGAFEEEFY